MRREVVSYRRSRDALVIALGGKCALAGVNSHVCGGELHIDHVDGRDYEVNSLSSHRRIARYWREYLAGTRLRLLCAKANGWDGRQRQLRRRA